MRSCLLRFAGLLGGSDFRGAGNIGGVGEPQAGACGFCIYGGVCYTNGYAVSYNGIVAVVWEKPRD